MDDRLLLYDRNVLEVLCLHAPLRCALHRAEIEHLSGYSEGTCGRAMAKLRRLGLAEVRMWGRFNSQWQATERGKIAFAIIVGQETARRNARLRGSLAR